MNQQQQKCTMEIGNMGEGERERVNERVNENYSFKTTIEHIVV